MANAPIAKVHQEQLDRIKCNVEKSWKWFKSNYERYNFFRKFVFKSTLSDTDKAALYAQNKPEIEFNICEAYISRLRGEWSKQMPAISVRASDDASSVNDGTIDLVEGHMRAALFDANNDGCEYNGYTDTLSGGFSVLKIWTEYTHEMAFDQIIKFGRVYDPTLCGFDPLATLPHKGDGNYCFELFPRTKDDFEREYPDIDLSKLKYTRSSSEEYNWSYNNGSEDVLLLCDYYEKKKKRTQIVQLANNERMTMKEYKEFLKKWDEMGIIEQPPAIKTKRWTDIETICRYRLMGSEVLEHTETDFKFLPLVFVDGNSIFIRNMESGQVEQVTRPYIYNAYGAQRLKNYAGQCLANELENQMQHKLMIAKEAIAEKYKDALFNWQKASTIVFNAFKTDEPNVPVPPPMAVPRTATPPEIMGTFASADQMIQGILGSYDASLGINDNQLSGIAIVEGATQSNSAAMPYVVSYMQAFNQIAQIYLDLLPKYYKTPRTIPIMTADGKRSFQMINQQGAPSLDYSSNTLQVKVEAGVNFGIQKSRAVQQIVALMQASPLFAQFINTEGLPILLDNLDMRGGDQLKEAAEKWMQEMKKQQAQQAQQPNPQMIAAQLKTQQLQQKAKQDDIANELRAEELTTNRLKVIGELQNDKVHNQVMVDKANVEQFGHLTQLAIKTEDQMHRHRHEAEDQSHRHAKESLETLNNLNQPT